MAASEGREQMALGELWDAQDPEGPNTRRSEREVRSRAPEAERKSVNKKKG